MVARKAANVKHRLGFPPRCNQAVTVRYITCMMHANIDESTPRTRALVTSAAASKSSAKVLGALFDLISTMRRRHAGTSGTSAILTKLVGGGPQRSCDLAERLNLDQSTVSRQVAQLESEGLVERSPMAEDRRAHLVDLTALGATTAHALITQRVAYLEGILATWPAEDVEAFGTLLERFTQELTAEGTPAV